MAYASQAGRARTSSTSPQAHAICDRCGFRFNFVDLQWQYEWRGAALMNNKNLVCRRCLDTPQENVRSIIVPADPQPIVNARVQDFDAAGNDYMVATTYTTDPRTGLPVPTSVVLTDQSGNPLMYPSIGAPAGEQILGQAPLVNAAQWAQTLTPLSITSSGTKTIAVSFAAPHGLTTGAQIGVLGSLKGLVDGIFTVTAVTATLLNYTFGKVVPAASLLTATTVVRTANIGVPYNASGVPQTGV